MAQAAVAAHVLLVVHRGDHRPGPQEQHCLEEGVREQVEHRGLVHADSCGGEHVSELRTGRIGDHALDVVLDETDRRREKRRGRADDRHHAERGRSEFEQRRHPAHEEYARRNHGGRVDESGNGRWTFHGVGQPCVEEQLRRFARSADEQKNRSQLGRVDAEPQEFERALRESLSSGEDVVEVYGVDEDVEREYAQNHSEIADPVDDERLNRRRIRRRLSVVESDQQIRGYADPFPTEEKLKKIVGGDQRQHREGKE